MINLISEKVTYRICGIIGIFGCFSVLITDILGIALHEEHNPIRNTISMLAIGKYGWIQDSGLDLLAVGFVAIAFGLYTWKNTGTRWILSLIILILIALDLVLIAEHNQYAGRPGYTIHRKLVYCLAVFFPVLLFMISSDLKAIKPVLKKISRWIAVLWLVMAPLMPLIPDNLNGAYERLTGFLIILWLCILSYHVYGLSHQKEHVQT